MNLNKSFSFTFTIPAFKKVYYNGKRRPYGSLSPNQQFHFLEDIMIKCINPLKFVHIDWVYEEHEDKRLHIHGFCICSPNNGYAVNILRDDFYSFGQRIGIKICSYLKLSDIQQTYYDLNYWVEYCNKNQNNIKYKNKYSQEIELHQALDFGLELAPPPTPPPTTSSPKLPNWCDEPENLSYGFKGKNFIEI